MSTHPEDFCFRKLVELKGIEPSTSWLSASC